MQSQLIELTDNGLYCEVGDFYIDPYRKVRRAVITHAHTDHARPGMDAYLVCAEGLAVARCRLGNQAQIQTLAYGESIYFNGVRLSFYPAGHILGSAQVLVEYKGERWVISGDYKTDPDGTCTPFEPVSCNVFITESTFALPIYHWQPQGIIINQINQWWQNNRALGLTSVLFGYALGKTQRILHHLDPTIGPIFVHSSIETLNEAYRVSGIDLPPTFHLQAELKTQIEPYPLVLVPPGIKDTAWLSKFGEINTAFASGWMQALNVRKRQTYDTGFVLSDHADWEGLLSAVKATNPDVVLVTHGFSHTFARYLNEIGIAAAALQPGQQVRSRAEDTFAEE